MWKSKLWPLGFQQSDASVNVILNGSGHCQIPFAEIIGDFNDPCHWYEIYSIYGIMQYIPSMEFSNGHSAGFSREVTYARNETRTYENFGEGLDCC